MAKLIYPINVSLDGYMEDESGDINWTTSDDELFAFWTDFQRSIGTYLYGRRMYESMVYWETEHLTAFGQIWQSAEKIVYSHTLQDVSSTKTKLEREFNPEAVKKLKESSKIDLTIGGPDLAKQAMKMGLVDEWHLLVHPIILGSGKRALPDHFRVQLELVNEYRFKSGVVHLHYRITN